MTETRECVVTGPACIAVCVIGADVDLVYARDDAQNVR